MPWVSGPSLPLCLLNHQLLLHSPPLPHLLCKLDNDLIACPPLILGTLNINYIHTFLQSAFLAFTPTLSLIKIMVILFASLVKYFHLVSGMRERGWTIHVTISELNSMTILLLCPLWGSTTFVVYSNACVPFTSAFCAILVLQVLASLVDFPALHSICTLTRLFPSVLILSVSTTGICLT